MLYLNMGMRITMFQHCRAAGQTTVDDINPALPIIRNIP